MQYDRQHSESGYRDLQQADYPHRRRLDAELGRRLAEELWQDLIGYPAVQDNPRLRKLLLKEPSFEVALGLIQTKPFTLADRQVFEKALRDAFIAMDGEISRSDHDPRINIDRVKDLLFQVCGQRNQGVNAGYVFTLNQDLWPERHLYNEPRYYDAPSLALPAVQLRPNQSLFTSDIGPYSSKFIMQPIEEPAARGQLRGNFNIIKLHGSFNWQTTDARSALVVGTEKSRQTAALPLLTWYFDIFRRVLSAGGVRLMIIGYGFGDEHVNAAIADAIEQHDLKVFIWDIGPNLRERVQNAARGASLWKGLLGMATRPMIEVFRATRRAWLIGESGRRFSARHSANHPPAACSGKSPA